MYLEKSCFGLIVVAIAALALSIVAGVQLYHVYQDIDAQMYRAQVSVEADKMASRLEDLRVNMEKHGMTSGYVFPLWGSPASDIGLDYEAVIDAHSRALLLAEQDRASVQYQSGMDDLRGTIREIKLDGVTFAAWRNPFLYIAVLLWIILIVMVFLISES